MNTKTSTKQIRTEVIHLKVTPQFYRAIERLAMAENRSRSGQLYALANEALKARGIQI